MKKDEFWKLYNEKYKGNMKDWVYVCDGPVCGDSGTFYMSCFQNSQGIWCIEETRERSSTPYHTEYTNEDDAFEQFLKTVHWRSKLDEHYIQKEKHNRQKFEQDFAEQMNGPRKCYVYIREFPPKKKGWPRIIFKTTCYLTKQGQWYIEKNMDGTITRNYYNTLEEAKEILYQERNTV